MADSDEFPAVCDLLAHLREVAKDNSVEGSTDERHAWAGMSKEIDGALRMVNRIAYQVEEADHVTPEADRKPGEVGGRTRALPVSNQASPVDTPPKPKMGRPRTGYIKAEYNRQYSADQRTIKRLGLNCTVKEWRLRGSGHK